MDPSKSSDPDNIPGRLFKEGAPWITEPLRKLFNHQCHLANSPVIGLEPSSFQEGIQTSPEQLQTSESH